MAKFTGTDLPQLSNGSDDVAVKKSILDLLDKINSVADAQYPVGYVYTQYPGTSDPATLFGGTWLNITSLYAGLFFRAEGGASLAFNAGNQTDLVGPHSHTASSGGSGALGHTHSVPYPTVVTGGSPNNPGTYINGGPVVPPPVFMTNAGTGYTGANSGTSGTNASIDHTHTITVNATTTAETRPVNTTIRIWQRSGGTLTITTGTSVTMGIYDSGTNSLGSWIRFTDGTMQCWGNSTITTTATIVTSYRSIAATCYRSNAITFNFPVSFISTPSVTYSDTYSAIGNSNIPTATQISPFVETGGANTQVFFYWQAIGKWK